MILAGLKACWRGLRNVNHRGYIYVWGNLLWLMLSLPIVTAPAAWAGLVHLSRVAHTAPSVNLEAFWEGFRVNLRRGFVLGVINFVVIGVNVVNLAAYWTRPDLGASVLRWLWLLILLVWLSIQLYLWPLFYEMKTPNLRGAFRNAAVMVYLNPLFTLGLWIVIVPVVFLSTFLLAVAWILITGGLLASIANAAVLDRLEKAGLRQPPPPSIPDLMGYEE